MTSDNDTKEKTASEQEESTQEESSEESLSEESSEVEESESTEEETADAEASEESDDEEASDDSDDEEASDDSDKSDDSDDEEASDDSDESDDDSDDEEASDDSDESDDDDSDDEEASDDSDESDDDDSDDDSEESDDDSEEKEDEDVDDSKEIFVAGANGDQVVPRGSGEAGSAKPVKGIAAFFDVPDDLMVAAAHTRDSDYEDFDAFSPFPIHGMDDAMGIGRSWIPWVTFGAGTAGLLTANALQFGTMTFDWPMIIGGKPYAPWPAFVPIMFELTVLLAGVITAIVMLVAAGCFRKPFIIDREITKDRFALWISADDEAFDADEVREFMKTLDPVEIRTITESA